MAQYTEAAPMHDGGVDLGRDEELVLRCQAGDPTAFAELYERYAARLTRFCHRRLRDRQEAEDVAQEAFVKAWRALPRFAGDRHFYPWLTVIARNLCTDALRRRSRSAPTADLDHSGLGIRIADVGPTTEEQIVAAADGELVHRALDRLNPRHRRVLELREGSDWSYREIARFEGVEVSAVETLVWRARQALKREFEALRDSRPALGAVVLVGSGVGGLRRLRAAVARHPAGLHPGRFRLGDVVATLVVTSAVATSAGLPAAGPAASTGHPWPGRAAASAPGTVPGTPTFRAPGDAPVAGGIRWGSGVAASTGDAGTTSDAGATSDAGGGRSSAATGTGPGSPAPAPTVPGPFGVPAPADVVAPVVSVAGGAATAATTTVGTALAVTGPIPIAGVATVAVPGAVAGGVSSVAGPVVAVTGPAGPTTASGPVGSVLGTR